MVTLLVVIFFAFTGAELGFGGWIYTYAASQDYASPALAASINAAFWAALTVGRLISIPLVVKLKPTRLLGPYKFVEWVKDDHITLDANKEWWGKKVDFERVILRPLPENATRVAALITGEIDAAWGVSIPAIPRVEKNKNTYVSRVPSQRAIDVMCDVFAEKGGPPPKDSPGLPAGKANPFKDFRVRKAIAHAINAEDIIKFVMEGSAYSASQIISPYAFDYSKSIQRPNFDPALARKLLAEAGYPNGFEANVR